VTSSNTAAFAAMGFSAPDRDGVTTNGVIRCGTREYGQVYTGIPGRRDRTRIGDRAGQPREVEYGISQRAGDSFAAADAAVFSR